MHVFDLLQRKRLQPVPVMATVGSQRFLQTLAARQIERLLVGEGQATRLDGDKAEWRDVADELDAGLLFAQTDHRLIIVDPAEPLITAHRERLEKLASQSECRATLLLMVAKLPGNTRLAKSIVKQGGMIQCNEPTREKNKRQVPDPGRSITWLIDWARDRHQRTLTSQAAALLWERVGPIYGLLDQELAKLALYTDDRIDETLVDRHCGSWRTQTAWQMIDAALDGRTGEAIGHLNQLLDAGEAPPALFGQLTWSLRRYATAARIYELAERRGRRMALREAIQRSGFRWQREIESAERRLRRMGRPRALKLPADLVELDLKLKGSHSHIVRARQALEQFLASL